MTPSSKSRHALRALCRMVELHQSDPVSLAAIAERQEISLSYLEQIFAKLKRASIVKSVRGPGGGYRPARPQNEILVSDVVRAIDGPTEEAPNDDPTADLWREIDNLTGAYLKQVTLGDLVSPLPR